MVAIEAIRTANTAFKSPSGLVALFVGATSGIGEITLRQFYKHTENPQVYFVGRNEEKASKIITDCKTDNPNGNIEFFKCDVTLMKNVDVVSNEFKQREEKLNLLFLTPGFLTMKSLDETTEGIDKKLSCNYYARARFIENLLPQLSSAASSTSFGARVISILAPGREGQIDESDWDLQRTYSIRNAEKHGVTFNTAAFQYLSSLHPDIGFIHGFPGFVQTGMTENSQLPGYVKWGLKLATPLLGMLPMAVPLDQSGERHLYLAINDKYKKGAWVVSEKSEQSDESVKNIEKGWCDAKMGEKVWKHTQDKFERAMST